MESNCDDKVSLDSLTRLFAIGSDLLYFVQLPRHASSLDENQVRLHNPFMLL